MKALKAIFLSRLLREKILLTGFLLLIAAWWFSHVARRGFVFLTDFKATATILKAQDVSLAGQAATDARVRRALSQFESSRTLDSARLQGDLNTLATSLGLPGTSIYAGMDEPADQFIKHSVQFSVRKVDFVTLQKFYMALSARAPYISIEQCKISVDPTTALLSASMRISSVEIVQ